MTPRIVTGLFHGGLNNDGLSPKPSNQVRHKIGIDIRCIPLIRLRRTRASRANSGIQRISKLGAKVSSLHYKLLTLAPNFWVKPKKKFRAFFCTLRGVALRKGKFAKKS